MASALSQRCGPRRCICVCAPCLRAVRLWPFLPACATCLLPWVTRPLPQAHTDSLNTLVALHQLYQYTQKYYDEVGGSVRPRSGEAPGRPAPGLGADLSFPQIINALEEDPAAQKMQLAYRLQQIAAALENKVTDL